MARAPVPLRKSDARFGLPEWGRPPSFPSGVIGDVGVRYSSGSAWVNSYRLWCAGTSCTSDWLRAPRKPRSAASRASGFRALPSRAHPLATQDATDVTGAASGACAWRWRQMRGDWRNTPKTIATHRRSPQVAYRWDCERYNMMSHTVSTLPHNILARPIWPTRRACHDGMARALAREEGANAPKHWAPCSGSRTRRELVLR
jgi:hypothetical protein